MKNLIVNADDLGWTDGVNRGIVHAHRNGIVTSASLLANGAAFESAVEMARAAPAMGVGVHLNLNDGKPVSAPESVPSLVNAQGEFAGGPETFMLRIARRNLNLKEVETEWDHQIQKVCDAGIRPTHVDGHKPMQMLPGLAYKNLEFRLAQAARALDDPLAHETSTPRAALPVESSTIRR